MTPRERRQQGMARITHLHEENGEFDRAFWQTVPAHERMALVWEMVLEYLAWMNPDEREPRLQRSVCRIERRGR